MKVDPIVAPPTTDKRGQALTQVLEQSEHAKDMVKECAEELSSVNSDLKLELQDREPLPGVEKALGKSEIVEDKVQEASEELAVVHRALEDEVKERHVLEHRLAEVTEQESAARHASFHDSLTGLPNRALFNDRLEHGLAQAKRHGRTLAVMFMDLNDFKIINDTHGHDVGDSVLQTIAQRLQKHTRSDDTICRHGGDEFLYLLTEIENEGAVGSIAEKLITLIHAPFELKAPNGTISFSINASVGISTFPKDGTTADALIKNADKAMYRAKRTHCGYSLAAERHDEPS